MSHEPSASPTAAHPEQPASACCRSRRAVLGGGLMGAAALTLAACAAPAEPEAAPSATGEGHEVMAASELKVGAQASVKINEADVIVYRQDESTVLAYSAICTHAGCTVVPGEDAKFHCPCHDSYFNVADGSVAGGPAPRPLTRFAATIEGDKVLVYL